jgi:hypothetical protein
VVKRIATLAAFGLACGHAAPSVEHKAVTVAPAPPPIARVERTPPRCSSWSRRVSSSELDEFQLLPTRDGGLVGALLAQPDDFNPPLGHDEEMKSIVYSLDDCGSLRFARVLRDAWWRTIVHQACIDEHDTLYLAGSSIRARRDPAEVTWIDWLNAAGEPLLEREFVSDSTHAKSMALSGPGAMHVMLQVSATIEIDGRTIKADDTMKPGTSMVGGRRLVMGLDAQNRIRYVKDLGLGNRVLLTSGHGRVFHEVDSRFAPLAPAQAGYVADVGAWTSSVDAWDLDGNLLWQKPFRASDLVADGAGGVLGETLLRPATDPRGEFRGRQLARFDAEGNETARVTKAEKSSAPRATLRAQPRSPFSVCTQHWTHPVTDGRGSRLEQDEARYLLYDASGALVAERPRRPECHRLSVLAWTSDGGAAAVCHTADGGALVEKWTSW